MTRYTKNARGHYLIHGNKYEMLEGSRAQVLHGTAYKTSGGLKKNELLQNKNGRIVSKKKHFTAKKEKRLVRAGFGTKKGKFGYVKIGKTKKTRGTKKMRGGYKGAAYSPAPVTGGSRRRRGGQGELPLPLDSHGNPLPPPPRPSDQVMPPLPPPDKN